MNCALKNIHSKSLVCYFYLHLYIIGQKGKRNNKAGLKEEKNGEWWAKNRKSQRRNKPKGSAEWKNDKYLLAEKIKLYQISTI